MLPKRPIHRFLLGFACALIVMAAGFGWVSAIIPTWGATPAEQAQPLPGDEIIHQPQISWNHAITINAADEQIYPWLAQIGDSRGGYYSYTFIENLFMIAAKDPDRYINADRIYPEWQNPAQGQGMIMDYLTIGDVQPNRYVLAVGSPDLPMKWTWLWYINPVDTNTSRLIVRHRFEFPAGTPQWLPALILNTGYVMERGMLLGIRERAEGRVPPAVPEWLDITLWLIAIVCGFACAVRFVRQGERWHPLGVGLESIIILFIFTFIQPAIWLRVLLDLVLLGSTVIAYMPGWVTRMIRAEMKA